MILEQLILKNFRVFKGEHVLNLSPKVKNGKKCPIILFGGLNGAGKTSILTAIRLVLYGKQVLGSGITNKSYSKFLASSVHRTKNNELVILSSSIILSFSYTKHGEIKHFSINRSWEINNDKVSETLTVSEDGNILSELNAEQCQGFLNDIIPIGVSDLFFFDGEKVVELAEDDRGQSLGNSVKKLLGLDLIETLDSDLSILLRNKSKQSASEKVKQEIISLEKQLNKIETQAESQITEYQQTKPIEIEAQKNIQYLEESLSSKGGAWAKAREEEVVKRSQLETTCQLLENKLKDLISDKFPISLAEQHANQTVRQLETERDYKDSVKGVEFLKNNLETLKIDLKKLLSNEDFTQVSDLIESDYLNDGTQKTNVTVIHDISDSLLTSIETIIRDASRLKETTVKETIVELSNVKNELEQVNMNLSRSPEDNQINPILEEIKLEQDRKTSSIKKQGVYLEKHKRSLRDAMEVVRKLDKLSEHIINEYDKDRTIELCSNTKSLLKSFSKEISLRKINELEAQLIHSFEKLSRKGDIKLNIQIDPKTFSVKLLGEDGEIIDKNELSAGEKQIYAIAMLEALAKTSGKKLPIIIDTPLGRLDSVHRGKLIENYFPHASHQVIMLSTDTEVDESFYELLSPEISRAYRLEYDSNFGNTKVIEGYFWENEQRKVS